ncbi:hypothetical protein Tco_0626395 [Tanacetum coccineum]|uniref:Uncharacterized protein n=1 Tax=Tanacetum coccineum TaxID=301880 RepID=A0ABQ4WJQ3_9ASTR
MKGLGGEGGQQWGRRSAMGKKSTGRRSPGRSGEGAHDKEGIRADVSAHGWSANDWLAPEGTKILPADQ